MIAMIWSVGVFLFRILVLFVIFASMLPAKKRKPKRWPCGRVMKPQRRLPASVVAEIAAPSLPFGD